MRRAPLILTTLALAGTLVACSGDEPAEDAGSAEETTSEETTSPEATEGEASTDSADAVLMTADSSLGEIIVDSAGMTLYYFSNDEPGSGVSACAGECAANWPALLTDSPDPAVEGVTAEVGTIEVEGGLQVTVDDRPVYYFVNDAAPGDVNGQGLNDVWWVIAPDGSEIG